MTPEADKDAFLIESYKLLFERNSKAQDHRWTFIQWSLFGIFAFYGGIFTSDSALRNSPVFYYLILLPTPLCILGGFLAWGLRQGMKERGVVMLSIERHFKTRGWEVLRSELEESKIKKTPLSTIASAYWIFMVVITCAVAFAAWAGWLFKV